MMTPPRFVRCAAFGAASFILPLFGAFAQTPQAAPAAPAKTATPAPAAEAPAVELPSPVFSRDAAGTVTIKGGPEGTIVCYTLDKSDPTNKSGPYLSPIDLPNGGMVKARVFSADRKQKSEATSETYEPVPGKSPIPSSLVAVTQDRSWPGYKWAERHAEVSSAVKEKQAQIVFIGDSINHFFNKTVFKDNYESRGAVNLGFGWDRTENVLWRLEHGELDNDPGLKVAIVMIGTNNLPVSSNTNDDIEAGIHAVVAEIHKLHPKTKILLLGIFPRGEKPGGFRDRIAEINKEISTLDGKDGVTYLDIGEKFLQPDGTIAKDVMGDFLHPTEKGYKIWVEAMEPTLGKLLAQ